MTPSFDLKWKCDLRGGGELDRLFEGLQWVQFFMKDAEFKIVHANPLFAEHCGFRRAHEIIGKTDFELFPLHLAEKYRKDDIEILKKGKPMFSIVELFPNKQKNPKLFLTDKFPLFDTAGRCCGVAGVIQDYHATSQFQAATLKIKKSTDFIQKNYGEKISVQSLAKMAGFSIRQFERHFYNSYKMSPREFIVRTRIDAASQLLKKSTLSISEIAYKTQFYDHSSFTRHFKNIVGMKPKDYRLGKVKAEEDSPAP